MILFGLAPFSFMSELVSRLFALFWTCFVCLLSYYCFLISLVEMYISLDMLRSTISVASSEPRRYNVCTLIYLLYLFMTHLDWKPRDKLGAQAKAMLLRVYSVPIIGRM